MHRLTNERRTKTKTANADVTPVVVAVGTVMTIWLTLLVPSCTTQWHVDDADREANTIIAKRTRDILGQREQNVIRPKEISPDADPFATDAGDGKDTEKDAVLELDLARSLEIAVESNRGYLSQKESLFQQGLSLSLTRFNFGPQVNSTIDYLFSDSKSGNASHGAGLNFGLNQILPTGGSLSFSSGIDAGWTSGSPDNYSTNASVNFRQPLLRGAGYEVSHESLTQAERSMVYAIRNFELFRQDFSIDIAQQFFNLVSEKRTLTNVENDYRQAVNDRKKAEALRKVDRNNDQEVFRARRREIEAENRFIEATAGYDRRKDDFKIQLGMPTSRKIVIVDAEAEYEPIGVDPVTAVAAARHNRLDIQTERDQLEDVERGVRISENNLLPDLDLTAGSSITGSDRTLGGALPEDWAVSGGISLEIPLQRKSERNSYRNALIGLDRARRGLSLTLDNLELSIRDQIRQLKSLEQQVRLQTDQIKDEERAVAVTQIRYESGLLDNRDLLEARQALLNARNALISQKVNHFIQRLRLLRSLGLLFINEKGMWR